jgi:hypothetical protein
MVRNENNNNLVQDGNVIAENSNDSINNSTSAVVNSINDLSNKEFSDKTNFLVINSDELNQTGINTLIERKFLEMENYDGIQLEFLLVDKDNKPILFKDFVDNFKLNLSPDIINNLVSDNFSLFLYKKDNIKRIDIVVGVKNRDLLKSGLSKNERMLLNDLAALFIYDKPDSNMIVQFKDSNYKNNLVRYANLDKGLSLSLDYSISGDYLIFATSKDSGRLIMDKLAGELVSKNDIFSKN